jgi:PAS domain S-box-containing protein
MRAIQAGDERATLKTLLDAEVAERKVLERELRLLREQFDAFFASPPEGRAILDEEFRYVQINDMLAEMTGYPAKELLGKRVREVVPQAAEALEPVMRKVLHTGNAALNVEFMGESPGEPGVFRHWDNYFLPINDPDGRVRFIAAVVFDVTAHKRIQEALSESESKYRILVEHSFGAVLVLDEEGNFVEINERACETFGFTAEEMLSLNAHDLMEDSVDGARLDFRELAETGVAQKRCRLRRKDGSLVEAEVIGSPVGNGKVQIVMRNQQAGRDQIDLPALQNTSWASRISGFPSETASDKNVRFFQEMSVAFATAAELLGQASLLHSSPTPDLERGIDLNEEVSRFEKELIKRALKQAGGKQRDAAQILGIKPSTLHAMMKRHNISARGD